ncbi:MAG: TetR/AcrR family transcriptional regulator [Gammaproteobacteria bacterium]|jgi:AcrR family transcriptional regulator|nr:MAG: TetR/AcrR family transcriptional regulator [Gammaproteobacteria bacterium]
MVGKRLKASERRATILAVAKVLFSDKGYHGVSVDEIAGRLGVSPAILYRHFASKEALYEEVLNEIACKRESYVEVVVNSAGGFGDVLRGITHIYVASVSKDPDYLRMELQSALEGSDATRQFFENRWRPFTDLIEYSLKELAGQNRIGPVNGAVAALLFQGMIREALYAKCIYRSPRYHDMDLGALVDHLIGLFFRAVGYVESLDPGTLPG